MSTTNRIDPELAAVFAAMAEEAMANGGWPTIPERGDALGLRKIIDDGMASAPDPTSAGVSASSHTAPTTDGSEIELRWYAIDTDAATPGPAVVYLHGGGMVGGTLDNYDAIARYYVQETSVPLLLVDYRLAPEHTGTPLAEDGFTGLLWLLDHADELGVDTARIAVMGDSGGGGVAAGTVILARDRGVEVAKQILVYPMLDDRTTEPDPLLDDVAIWSYDNNWTCWTAVLGEARGTDAVSPIAAPGRLVDFAGLPRTYIEVGELDIFREESIAYAQGLLSAGISCELHVHPGVVHGHDRLGLDIGVTRRTFADRCRVIAEL